MLPARAAAVRDDHPRRVEGVNDIIKGWIGALDDYFGQVAGKDDRNPVREVLP